MKETILQYLFRRMESKQEMFIKRKNITLAELKDPKNGMPIGETKVLRHISNTAAKLDASYKHSIIGNPETSSFSKSYLDKRLIDYIEKFLVKNQQFIKLMEQRGKTI